MIPILNSQAKERLSYPTKPMLEEALGAGFNTWFQRNYPRLQIVTIQEIIAEGKRIDLPLNPLILKTAPTNGLDTQANLLE